MGREPDGFHEFVVARSAALIRTAWMLTGDSAQAEDLLQTALARTWPHWNRIASASPEAYVRTVMVRTNASWRSRHWNREHSTDEVETASDASRAWSTDEHLRSDDRMVLATALASLPTRQRQAVVLRYFDDLSVDEAARIMNSAPGTVKSQSAKGLAKLRQALTDLDAVAASRRDQP